MLNRRSKVRLPLSYYIRNGEFAEKVMMAIQQGHGELADITLAKLREMALKHEQEYMGEPTFAKAVVELIDRTKTNSNDKLKLISDITKMTIIAKIVKTGEIP